ncbi:MAG: ATP-binding protein [Candidatus Hodarchaeales archaeon]|jgi:ferredoxin
MSDTSETDTDIYQKLFEVLNTIPEGFPITEDGTHIKILKYLFTEEEAELTSKLKLWAETAEALSVRLNIQLPKLTEKLEEMVKKGIIHGLNTSTGRKFGLIPYAVGIYEEQVKRMDKEFAQLHEDLFNKGQYDLFETEPSIFKVIPVNEAISNELVIHPYEKVEEIINRAKSWAVRECICKKQQGLLDNPCKYPSTVCLVFSSKEDGTANNDNNQVISKEQALEYLNEAEEAGLIHCTMNVQTGHYYICNCCTCCCAVLRGLTQRNQPRAFVKSNFEMNVDEDLCTGCGSCVDRCQFDALEVVDDLCEVDLQRCVGCGVCASECPEDALTLVERETKTVPPETIKDWMTQKAKARQVDPSDLL